MTGGRTHLQLLAGLVGRWGGYLVGQYSLGSFFENFDEAKNEVKIPSTREKLNELVWGLVTADEEEFQNGVS